MFHGQAGNGSVGRKEFSLYSSFHFLGNKGESRSCRSRIHVLTLSCVCRWSGCKTKIVANSDFVLNDSVFWCLCHGIFVSWVNYVTGTLCRLSWHTWWTVSWQLFWIVVIYDWVCELCWSLCFFGGFFFFWRSRVDCVSVRLGNFVLTRLDASLSCRGPGAECFKRMRDWKR